MSERWIEGSKLTIEKIRELSAVEEKDRLDFVRSIRTSLNLLGRSLRGWARWVNNPITMAVFSKEELEEVDKTLSKFAESFIEYDIKVNKLGLEKGLKITTAERRGLRWSGASSSRRLGWSLSSLTAPSGSASGSSS